MLCGRVLVLSDGPMIWALSKRLGVPHFVMTTAPEDMDHAVALAPPNDAVGAWETRVPDGLPNRDAQIAAVCGSYQLTPAQVERSVRGGVAMVLRRTFGMRPKHMCPTRWGLWRNGSRRAGGGMI